MSIDRRGIYSDLHGGESFVLHGGKAYAVALDVALASWRLAAPGDRSQMGQRITRNARGDWEIREDVALPQTGRPSDLDAVRSDAQKRQYAATCMLRHPSASEAVLAARLALPISTIRKIAADVDAARRAWRAAGTLGAPAQVLADAPLTPGERAFIDRWADSMSANNFAELMQYPRRRIDTYLQSDEHRSALASLSRPAAASGEAASTNQDIAEARSRRGAKMIPAKKARVVRMLSSNPTMSYSAVAKACSVSCSSVIGVARAHGLLRDRQSQTANARDDLFDDFVLFPGTGARELAEQYRLPVAWVRALRHEFAPIRADWNAIYQQDIADNRPELGALLPDGAKQFIRQWGDLLSATNLAIVMKMPTFVIDAYRRSAGYLPPPAASPCASGRAQQSPQPGPSGSQAFLTDAQKAVVLEWAPRGMRPDSLSTYLSMHLHAEVPPAAIEAFIASPEYRRKALT
ncbi:hypothetical protein [Paraburkholderia sp. 2C]